MTLVMFIWIRSCCAFYDFNKNYTNDNYEVIMFILLVFSKVRKKTQKNVYMDTFRFVLRILRKKIKCIIPCDCEYLYVWADTFKI